MKKKVMVFSLAASMCLILTACGQYDASAPEYTGVSSGRDSYFAPAAGSSSFGSSETSDSSTGDSSYVDGQVANVANDVSQMQDAQNEYGDALDEAMQDVGNFESETDAESGENSSEGYENTETVSENETDSESESATGDGNGSSESSSGSGGGGSESGRSSDENSEDTSDADSESETNTENIMDEDPNVSVIDSNAEDADEEESEIESENESEIESESESESEGISMAELLFPEIIENETEDPSDKNGTEDESDFSDESETEDDEFPNLSELNDELIQDDANEDTVLNNEFMTEEMDETENKFSVSLVWSGTDSGENDETEETESLSGIAMNESETSDSPIADVLDEAMNGMESVMAGESEDSIDASADMASDDGGDVILDMITDDIIAADDLFSDNVSDNTETTDDIAETDNDAMDTDPVSSSGDDVLYSLQQYLTQELNVMADSLWGDSDSSDAADASESMENAFLEEESSDDVSAAVEDFDASFDDDADDMQDVLPALDADTRQPDDLNTGSDLSDDLTKYEEILSLSDEFTPYLDDFQAQLEQMQQDIQLDTDLSSGIDINSADSLITSLDSLDLSSGSPALSADMESYLESFQSEMGGSFDSNLDISGFDTDSMFNMFMISSIVDEIQSYSMDSDLSVAIDTSSFDSLFSGFSDSLLGN